MRRQFRNLKFGDKFQLPASHVILQKERGCCAVNAFGPPRRRQIFPGVLVTKLNGEDFDRVARLVRKARKKANDFGLVYGMGPATFQKVVSV